MVVCDGAGGLLLLMHPDRTGIRINKLARTFIMTPLSSRIANGYCIDSPVVNAMPQKGFPPAVRHQGPSAARAYLQQCSR